MSRKQGVDTLFEVLVDDQLGVVLLLEMIGGFVLFANGVDYVGGHSVVFGKHSIKECVRCFSSKYGE